MFNRKNSEKISFVSTVDGLELIDECMPKPAKYFIPEWFKGVSTNAGTVRHCPSFPDYFSLGYVIPMWMDSMLVFDKETDTWRYQQSTNDLPSWEIHGNDQMIDYVTPYFNGVPGQFIFKANCPWKIITPPGWSVMQLPLFYHFNQEWSVLPGVLDTDILHDINPQVLYHGNGKMIEIDRGTPLALYIPFERGSSLEADVRYQTEKDIKTFKKNKLEFSTIFEFKGRYRKAQRSRDKNV